MVVPQNGPSGEGVATPSTSKASASKGKKNNPNETESPRRSSVSALQNEHQITVHQNAIDNQIVQNMGGSMDVGDPNSSLSSDYNDEDHDDIIDSDGPQDDLSLGGGVDAIDTSPDQVGCEDILNDFIQENYGTKIPEDHLAPPVSALLASTIDNWCLQVPTKDIKQAFEQCKVPSNIIALSPIKINDIIYHRLPPRAREKDKLARNNASYYIRAMGPLAYIWNVLIKAEAWALKMKSARPSIKTQHETVPLRDLIACVSASMKLLSINVSLYLQCRKSALCPHLDPKYHTLAAPSNKITSFLFGDNLEQKVSDIFKISQAARSNRFQAVQGRSRIQHRSFHPRRKF